MAFKRQENPRGLELTSLIDIVFLLLIFFLVSFAFSLGGDVTQSAASDIALPEAASQSPVLGEDRLHHLMIQVVPDTAEGRATRTVYILWPALADTAAVTRQQAFETCLRDSNFATFPADFMTLGSAAFAETSPCGLMTASIARYLAARKSQFGAGSTTIEVRAEQNTEFRVLDFIMTQCSRYQDDIPQLVIRTRPRKTREENGLQKSAS